MAMLIVLSLSLWCFAVAETLENSVRFALAIGGIIYFILGFGAALAIDSGARVAERHRCVGEYPILGYRRVGRCRGYRPLLAIIRQAGQA